MDLFISGQKLCELLFGANNDLVRVQLMVLECSKVNLLSFIPL